MEYYNERVLFRISKTLGKLLKIDHNTATTTCGKYARICIQVDFAEPLIPNYTLQDKVYRVEYECIHSFCFKCGRMGHHGAICPIQVTENIGQTETSKETTVSVTNSNVGEQIKQIRITENSKSDRIDKGMGYGDLG